VIKWATTPCLAAVLASAVVPMTAMAEPSAYADLRGRAVKSLSEAEVADLLAGRGAGMALPAELNHYPGPRHTLDLSRQLQLSPEQEAQTQRLFADMRAEAVPLGQALVAKEAELDRMFASSTADEPALRTQIAEAAQLRGELRFTHLKYHLAMRRLLTSEQVTAYDAERGYTTPTDGHLDHGGEAAHRH
jgi:Spy/CpxP family protein refolding chaperone